MSIAETYPRLVDDLDSLRRQWRAQRVLAGVLQALAVAGAALLLAVAIDNLFKLPTVGRAVLALGFWATCGLAVMNLVVRRVLEDRRDDFFAALVEERHPELSNQLINALQLGRGNHYGSRRLIEAIVDDAAVATADLEMTDCLDPRLLKRSAIGLGVAAAVVILYALLMPSRFGNGLARVLIPWADIPPYTATVFADNAVKPGDIRIPEGASVPVEVQLSGKVPSSASLYRRGGEQPWRTASMQRDAKEDARFRFTVMEAGDSFDYYIAAGDARSRRYRVEVVPRPRVQELKIGYALPNYVALKPQPAEVSDGEIAGIAGTAVHLSIEATKPLRQASLVTDNNEIIELTQGAGNRIWQASFVIWTANAVATEAISGQRVTAPSRYQIRLLDTDGYENSDPLWHSIALVKDQAPSVTINAPGRDVQSKPGETVTLALTAKDDFGLASVSLNYRVNEETTAQSLKTFSEPKRPRADASEELAWNLADLKLESGDKLKSGDVVQYWATAIDRNSITGPGQTDSRRFSIFIVSPEEVLANLELQMLDYAEALEELVRLQRENRAQTASGVVFQNLVTRQTLIRVKTNQLAGQMERDANPAETMVEALQELHAGPMADAIRLLEAGQGITDPAKAGTLRDQSLPVQDEIIAKLQELLARLQKNDQARAALKKLAKTDQPAHQAITAKLNELVDDLDRMLTEEEELVNKFDKLPKKPVAELNEEQMKALEEFDEFQERWAKWAKGSVDELTKLPTGFVDDFGLKEDVNRVFEEIETVAKRPPTTKLEVALEDLGAGMATEMLEDLELWMPDAPDALQWVLEEPLSNSPLKVPEMPLPSELEDLVGELVQEAEEFDEEADDITSAWGDNLNQAGWGVADGPISNFSAKGKTGNDLPNNMEVTGRAGDGRRGKSSGQMVGDTSRALAGRKTPARVNNERYEPGQLKQEGEQDPNGATGGGKKAGAGRRGLQGGTPPDFVRDMDRLSEKQAALREKAEQIAQKLDTAGVNSSRITKFIQLMKTSEADLRDGRYDDAARRRGVALSELKSTLSDQDQTTALQLSRARELPSELREELLQSADEGYPKGYESLLKSYFRALSEGEK